MLNWIYFMQTPALKKAGTQSGYCGISSSLLRSSLPTRHGVNCSKRAHL